MQLHSWPASASESFIVELNVIQCWIRPTPVLVHDSPNQFLPQLLLIVPGWQRPAQKCIANFCSPMQSGRCVHMQQATCFASSGMWTLQMQSADNTAGFLLPWAMVQSTCTLVCESAHLILLTCCMTYTAGTVLGSKVTSSAKISQSCHASLLESLHWNVALILCINFNDCKSLLSGKYPQIDQWTGQLW